MFKTILQCAWLLCLGCLLNACGNGKDNSAEQHEVMSAKDTVFAPQVQALDKAKAVQGTLDQAAAQTDAALKDAESR